MLLLQPEDGAPWVHQSIFFLFQLPVAAGNTQSNAFSALCRVVITNVIAASHCSHCDSVSKHNTQPRGDLRKGTCGKNSTGEIMACREKTANDAVSETT